MGTRFNKVTLPVALPKLRLPLLRDLLIELGLTPTPS